MLQTAAYFYAKSVGLGLQITNLAQGVFQCLQHMTLCPYTLEGSWYIMNSAVLYFHFHLFLYQILVVL